MMGLRKNSVHLIFFVVAGTAACGRDLEPASATRGAAGAPTETGGTGGAPAETAGAGGAPAETGGTGGTGGSDCPILDVNRFAACWDDTFPVISDEDGHLSSDLSFVGAVEPDESYCVQGFPYHARSNWTSATAPFVAWEFEDPLGDRLVVQFSIKGLMPDALRPGDIVDLHVEAHRFMHSSPIGAVWLEVAGAPIGLFFNSLPAFQAAPDFAIESADAMCAEKEGEYCGVPRAIRVTANSESGVVPFAESALVGGLTVFNAAYYDNRDCAGAVAGQWEVYRPHVELGLYAVYEE